MTKVSFRATLKKFEEHGEKTGWTFIEINADTAQDLLPGNKKSFRVKGKVDHYRIEKMALMPVGDGRFIMPLKADIRKAIGKQKGATVSVQLSVDSPDLKPPAAFVACLQDEPKALDHFGRLPKSHQHYFIRWIEQAKTDITKAKRIAQAINALSYGSGFAEMLRSIKEQNSNKLNS